MKIPSVSSGTIHHPQARPSQASCPLQNFSKTPDLDSFQKVDHTTQSHKELKEIVFECLVLFGSWWEPPNSSAKPRNFIQRTHRTMGKMLRNLWALSGSAFYVGFSSFFLSSRLGFRGLVGRLEVDSYLGQKAWQKEPMFTLFSIFYFCPEAVLASCLDQRTDKDHPAWENFLASAW